MSSEASGARHGDASLGNSPSPVMAFSSGCRYIEEDRAQEKRSYDILNQEKLSAKGAKVRRDAAASPLPPSHFLLLSSSSHDLGSCRPAAPLPAALLQGAKGSKYDADDVAEAKEAKGEAPAGSKAASKYEDDDVWSKEADYF